MNIRSAIDKSIRTGEVVKVELKGDDTTLHEQVSATWTGEWECLEETDGWNYCYSNDWTIRVRLC